MWVGGRSRSLDDTPQSGDVIPPLALVHLLGRGTGPLRFRSGRLARGDNLSAASVSFLVTVVFASTSHSHGSSLCGLPRSHSTGAVTAR